MIANIVFSIVLLACYLLVEMQTMMMPSIQVPSEASSFPQIIRDTNSWLPRPQISPSGPSHSRDRRPSYTRHRRLIVASKSSDNNDQTRLTSSSDDKLYHSVSEGSSEIPTAVGMVESIWELKTSAALKAGEATRPELHYWIGNQSSDEDAATAAAMAILNKYKDENASSEIQSQNENLKQYFYDIYLPSFSEYRPHFFFTFLEFQKWGAAYTRVRPIRGKRWEAEGQESSSFKLFFEKKLSIFSRDLSTDVDEERIFVIERKNTNHQEEVLKLKEVELPLAKVLEDERGCYIFALDKVYLCCGIKASVRGKLGGAELARIMMKKKGLKDEEIITYQTDRLFSRKTPQAENVFNFLKKFENLSQTVVIKNFDNDPGEFTPKELRAILNHTAVRVNGKEWFMIKVTRISNSPELDEVQEELLIPLHKFVPLILEYHSKDCLLVDSRSNFGLFLWLGKETVVEFVAECARRAEFYLRKTEYNYANRITFVHQEGLPPDIDSAQKMVEFVVALYENGQEQSFDLSSPVEDSSQD